MIANELHHLGRKFLGILGTIADADMIHQIPEPHDPQTDPPGPHGRFPQLWNGRDVGVGIHDIVQEARGEGDALTQFLPIDGAFRPEMLGQINRSQAAVLIGPKPLLPAGICGFQFIKVGQWVAAVGGVQEEHPWLAVMVRLAHNPIEQLAGPDAPEGLERNSPGFHLPEAALELAIGLGRYVRKAQLPPIVLFHSLHKGIGDTHRDIEIG